MAQSTTTSKSGSPNMLPLQMPLSLQAVLYATVYIKGFLDPLGSRAASKNWFVDATGYRAVSKNRYNTVKFITFSTEAGWRQTLY